MPAYSAVKGESRVESAAHYQEDKVRRHHGHRKLRRLLKPECEMLIRGRSEGPQVQSLSPSQS
jgi:hypothetical protein